jgi:hypothetical protein
LDEITQHLREELLDVGVDSATRPSISDLPEGAKGVDIPTLNQIAVAVAPGALSGLITFLRKWKLQSKTRILKIETPGGYKVEFPTDKVYSEKEFLAFLDKLKARE